MGAAIHASFSVPLLIGGPLLPFLDIHRPVQYPLRACNEQAATLDDSFSPAELYISIDDTPAGFSLAEATIIPCSREIGRILPPCTPKSCKHGYQDNVSCLERETDLSVWSRRKYFKQENRVWSHQWSSNCCRSRLRFDAAHICIPAWAAVPDVGLNDDSSSENTTIFRPGSYWVVSSSQVCTLHSHVHGLRFHRYSSSSGELLMSC